MIVGIIGKKGAGKDTVANMLCFIHYYKDNKECCTYNNYINYLGNFYSKASKHAFADKVKQVASIMYNIELSDFYDRDKKDNLYYNIKTKRYYNDDEGLVVISDNFDKLLSSYYDDYHVVKLRNILQYIGTDVFRKLVNDNIWVDITMNSISDNNDNLIDIITDVRFKNEADAIKCSDGLLIKVTNTTLEFDNNADTHESETVLDNYNPDISLLWFGRNKETLFNELLDQYNYILNNK